MTQKEKLSFLALKNMSGVARVKIKVEGQDTCSLREMRSVWPVFGRKIDQIDIKMKAMWGCQKERKNNEFWSQTHFNMYLLLCCCPIASIFTKNKIK